MDIPIILLGHFLRAIAEVHGKIIHVPRKMLVFEWSLHVILLDAGVFIPVTPVLSVTRRVGYDLYCSVSFLRRGSLYLSVQVSGIVGWADCS
jgi:hypothetical protein